MEVPKEILYETDYAYNKTPGSTVILLSVIEEYFESIPIEPPVKPEIADKELISATQLVMLLATGFKTCDKSVSTHWCSVKADGREYNVYIQP